MKFEPTKNLQEQLRFLAKDEAGAGTMPYRAGDVLRKAADALDQAEIRAIELEAASGLKTRRIFELGARVRKLELAIEAAVIALPIVAFTKVRDMLSAALTAPAACQKCDEVDALHVAALEAYGPKKTDDSGHGL